MSYIPFPLEFCLYSCNHPNRQTQRNPSWCRSTEKSIVSPFGHTTIGEPINFFCRFNSHLNEIYRNMSRERKTTYLSRPVEICTANASLLEWDLCTSPGELLFTQYAITSTQYILVTEYWVNRVSHGLLVVTSVNKRMTDSAVWCCSYMRS